MPLRIKYSLDNRMKFQLILELSACHRFVPIAINLCIFSFTTEVSSINAGVAVVICQLATNCNSF